MQNMWKIRRTEDDRSANLPCGSINGFRIPAEDGFVSLPPNLINWHIPRPSLWCADSTRPSSISREQSKWPGHQNERGSTSSQASSSSNTSTQSGASGSLLLTAANLAALRYEPTIKSPETQSVASSTHFTVVNGITRRKTQPLSTCCCQSHQLTTLVFTMSSIFLVAIIMAVIYLEMRWRDIHLFRWRAFPNVIWNTIPQSTSNSSLAVHLENMCCVFHVLQLEEFQDTLQWMWMFQTSKTNETMAVIFFVQYTECS